MIAFFSNWFMLFPVAFSLFVGLRLAECSVDRGQPTLGVLTIRVMIALLFAFSLLAVGLRASALSLTWMVLLALFAFVIFWKNRRLERSAMLYTALGTVEPADQAAVAEFFRRENRGWVRRKATRLGRSLATGLSWWLALETLGIAKGVYERLAVRLQQQYGPQATKELQVGFHRMRSQEMLAPLQIEAEAERLLGRLLIFSWVVFLVPLVSMMMMFILPTFKEMFEEFGLELPPVMLAVIAVADGVGGWGAVVFGLLSLLILLTAGLGLLLWIFPQWMQLPGLRWLGRDYYRNVGYAAFARSLEQHPDLIQACVATENLVCIANVSQNYAHAAQLLRGGMSPSDAFVGARILSRRETQQLGLDDRDPSWGLQQMANWKATRMLARYSAVVQSLVVGLTLLLALIVGAVAVGFIQSLSTMIWSLS